MSVLFPSFLFNHQPHLCLPLCKPLTANAKFIVVVDTAAEFEDGLLDERRVVDRKESPQLALGTCLFVRHADHAILFETRDRFCYCPKYFLLRESALDFMDARLLDEVVNVLTHIAPMRLLKYESKLFHITSECCRLHARLTNEDDDDG
jgi:hypothetical protein